MRVMYAERTMYDKYIPQNRQYCKDKGAGNISHNVSLQFRSFQKFFSFIPSRPAPSPLKLGGREQCCIFM